MSIIPGTTPTLTLSLDKSITGCTAAEFCLVCGTVRILRPLSELSISADGTEVSLRLMIFVFLYCIGKMTKLNFKANQSKKANIFQRYPVVWWTNFLLTALLLLSSWGWFVQSSLIGGYIISVANCAPGIVFIVGTSFILIMIIGGIVFFHKKTQFAEHGD